MTIHNKDIFNRKPSLLKGNLQIIACAGSGKTEFVSERIAFQIKKKIAKPEEIVAFTFTDKASEELKFRVRSKIKELIGHQPDIGDMYIGTIHAFAFNILKEFIPKYQAYDMLDEIGRFAFLSSIRNDIDIQYLTNSLQKRYRKPWMKTTQGWVFKTFISDMDKFREESWDLKYAISDSFRNAYNVYCKKTEEKRFLDFSSILKIAVDTLKSNAKIRKKVRNQYKFFTVDEYQDINPIQEELIQLISNKKDVCIVGDDDQSIYQWRGADVNNILTFRSRYSNVATHKLLINRRSHDAIISASSDLIKRNKKRLSKIIKNNSVKTQDGDLYKIIFDKQEEEIEWILEKIKHLIGKEYLDSGKIRKLKYSDIAILFRSVGNEGEHYINALKHAEIPIIYSGIGGLFDTIEVSSIINIFEYLSECDNDVVYDKNYLKELYKNLSVIFNFSFSKLSKDIENIKQVAKSKRRLSLQGIYGLILNMLGLANETYHSSEEVLLYNLGRLSQAISDYEGSREYLTFNSIKDFIWFIRLHAGKSYDIGDTDAMAGLVDAIQIITMHGTKGLGFPVVFMPGHFKKNSKPDFGSTYIDTSKVDISRFLNKTEDERRLFYVALTRAKKYLFITSAEYKINGKRRSSRNNLFDEIPVKHFLTEPVKDPTKRKKCSIEGISEEINFPTNYSEMSYYLNCGYDYKLRFIYGFKPGIMQAIGFGKQIHNIINMLHREYEDTKTIPEKNYISALIDEHFYMRYASIDVERRLKVSAQKSILKYVKMWEDDFSLTIKTERPFELEFENALISGAIDLIKRADTAGDMLEVIDFKTGKPDNDLKSKYELQVQLYTIAAKEALGINTENALIHLLDDNKNERIKVPTTDYALNTAKERISYAISGITTGRFKRDARQNKTCKSCDWCDICPKRKGYRA